MDCRNVQRHLSAFMDGILDAQTSALVKKHLSACRECQRELESLKTLVSDLGNLETVKAPDDFIEQLHRRMDAGFDFSKWIRTLFVPFRVKIPLELATAVAMAILIFAIVYRPQMEKEISPAPLDKIYKTIEEKKTDTIAASAPIEKRAELAEPAVKSARSGEPDYEKMEGQPARRAAPPSPGSTVDTHSSRISSIIGGEMIDFDLLLQRRATESGSLPAPKEIKKETMEEADAKKIGGIALKNKEPVDYQKAGKAVSELTTKRSGLTDETDTWVLSPYQAQKQIEALITKVRGTVVSTHYQNGTDMPKSIIAEIPAKQYSSFYSQLQRIGTIQSPMPTARVEGIDPVRIRIRFIAE